MTAFRNDFANGRFLRVQPRELARIPFAAETSAWRVACRVMGIVLLWCVVVGVSLWSISESMEVQRREAR